MFFESVGNIRDKLEPFIEEKDKHEEWLDAPNYYGLYFAIAKGVKPWAILEIGVRFGYSAISMLLGCGGECDYYGIDNESYEPLSNKIAEEKIRRVCSETVQLIKGDTQGMSSLPPELNGKEFDIIHADGAHRAHELKHDLDLILPHVHDFTYVLVDDTEHPGHTELKGACREWCEANGFEYVELDSYRGMTVMRKSRSKKAAEKE